MKSAAYFPLQSVPRCDCKLIVFAFLLGFLLPSFAGRTFAQELRTVEAIRELTVAQTRQKIPVHLQGVVTFYDERLYSRFIQDDTAGIYLQFPVNVGPPALVPGQLVDVTGTCSPGEYAPVVVVEHVQTVGKAPLPAPKTVSYEQLASGVEDSQFIEISGIVRSVQSLEDSQYHLLEIATGGGRLLVYARDLPVKAPDELLDSTVRVRGVCSTKFNHQRQLFSIRLMVPRPEDLEIELPAPKDPYAIAARPIGSLLQFAPQETYGHRVKIAGTVIYCAPDGTIFLQKGDQGVEVQTRQRDPLQLGDHVEVLGFVNQGEYTPMLQDAVYRKISSGPPPRPALLTIDEALKGNYDCRLIRVTARVLDRTQHGSERYLILQDGDIIFHAYLKQAEGEDAFPGLKNGSSVAVTGVCQIDPGEWEAGDAWRAKAFSLQLRSSADVILLRAPPWWTLSKVLWMTGAFGFVAVAAFGWIAVLRRQVAERTLQLEVQIQERQRADRRRVIEQERARLAHDLHDDLGAGLTEVNMLSSLVKSSATSAAEKQRYLDDLTGTALRMVTSLDEIVWAVNPRNDTIASLASYFGSYAQRLLDLADVTCGLDIAEELPEHPLDPKFRQQLFFSFKEALTNIVRHARATQVWLRIAVREHRLEVEVSDNGHGFNLSEPRSGSDGLANMQERLKALGGVCEIVSDAQNGTMVRFSAPLPERLL
ncbi:MAG TPA: ATP-binding protein [Verrucomicrobiae bacterium]|nr:ATP-binding protein [Verrucomicrobiae bacterium]